MRDNDRGSVGQERGLEDFARVDERRIKRAAAHLASQHGAIVDRLKRELLVVFLEQGFDLVQWRACARRKHKLGWLI